MVGGVFENAMTTAKERVLEVLRETGVVAVIRIEDPSQLSSIVGALRDGGIRMVEITMTVDNALAAITEGRARFGTEVIFGAGTVLDATTARMAILSGADYVVSPTFDAETVRMCRLYDTVVMSGALTPTEVVTAWKAGSDVVKIFPGRVGTPGYLKDLSGPLPQVRLMPTGNVNQETAPEYIRAGAVAVGVGRAVVDPVLVSERRFDSISKLAHEFCEIVRDARTESR